MIRKIVPFFVLFTPQKSFEVYYIIIFLILFFIFNKKRVINKNYILIFIYCTFLIMIRTLSFMELDDFKELIKVTFFLIVLNYFYIIDSNNDFKYLNKILLLFVLINLIVVLNQIFSFNENLNTFVSGVFLAESQQVLLTYNNVRATGLSPGVGQQGVVFLMLSMFFWYLTTKEKSKLNYFLLACSILILLLSQSKTCFIAFLLFVSVQVFYSKNKIKYLVIPVFLYLMTLYFNNIIILFKEYNDLINNLGSSSLEARFHNWMNFIKLYIDKPLSVFIGIGRNYLNSSNLKSSVFDSDYVYVIVNFGFIGIIIFGFFLLNLLKKYYKFNLFILTGIFAGLTINFFLEPKSFFLLLILFNHLKSIMNEEEHILDTN